MNNNNIKRNLTFAKSSVYNNIVSGNFCPNSVYELTLHLFDILKFVIYMCTRLLIATLSSILWYIMDTDLTQLLCHTSRLLTRDGQYWYFYTIIIC